MLVQIPSLSHSFIVFLLSPSRTISFSTLSLFSLRISWFRQHSPQEGECVGRIQGRKAEKRFTVGDSWVAYPREVGNLLNYNIYTCETFNLIRLLVSIERGESPQFQTFLSDFVSFSICSSLLSSFLRSFRLFSCSFRKSFSSSYDSIKCRRV